MTDQPHEHATGDDTDDTGGTVDVDQAVHEPTPDVPTPVTGHPAVDEVLRSLEGLDGRPVDEHVAAFEDAHEQLRRALSHSGEDQA